MSEKKKIKTDTETMVHFREKNKPRIEKPNKVLKIGKIKKTEGTYKQ